MTEHFRFINNYESERCSGLDNSPFIRERTLRVGNLLSIFAQSHSGVEHQVLEQRDFRSDACG